jgi:hypothetical protein
MGNIMEKGIWQNKLMGNMAMDECKYRKTKSCSNQTGCKHFKQGYGRLQLGFVYTCH